MSAIYVPCGICGRGIRFDSNASGTPASAVCESESCQTALKRQQDLATKAKPEPKAKK